MTSYRIGLIFVGKFERRQNILDAATIVVVVVEICLRGLQKLLLSLESCQHLSIVRIVEQRIVLESLEQFRRRRRSTETSQTAKLHLEMEIMFQFQILRLEYLLPVTIDS